MNNTEHLISIVVPVYNVEKYIHRCIDSILSQTYKYYEIILVDDGSPDNCPQICEDYSNKYNNIFVIHLKNSGAGVSDARNAGIELAKGEYITFIDSDDYVHEKLLEVLINAIVICGVRMSMCSYKRVNDKKKEIESIFYEKKIRVISDSEAMDMLLDNQALSACWGKLFDIGLFNNVRYPVGKYNEDMFITPIILRKAKSIAISPQILYFYSQDAPSLVRARFNYHKLDMVEATNFWDKQIELYYPELSEKARIHYYTIVINSCQYIANKTDELGMTKYEEFKNDILSKYTYILNSKYTTKNSKIKVILLKFGLFRLVIRFIVLLNIRSYDVGF